MCGASARPRATFCPQCGRSLQEIVSHAAPLAMPSPDKSNAFVHPQEQSGDVRVSQVNETNITAIGDVDAGKMNAPDVSVAREEGDAMTGRDAAALKQRRVSIVEESSAPERRSGERLRESSAQMLDEAADDASLRFVLVAIVLFILFLFFLLLNNLVG